MKSILFLGFRVGAAHYSIWGGAYFAKHLFEHNMNIGLQPGSLPGCLLNRNA
jgi:hypothetical protein